MTVNWIQIAPFGDWPHSGGTQRFTCDDAEKIIEDFSFSLQKLKKFIGRGIPFYIGFPDHQELKSKYKDATAYGYVTTLSMRPDGLWGKVRWKPEGLEIVKSGKFKSHAVNWMVIKDIEGFWRPFRIKSIGFTDEPNIPVIRIENGTL